MRSARRVGYCRVSAVLEDWDRPYFKPEGGLPNLTFIAYGPAPKEWQVSRSKYGVSEIPEAIDISRYGPDTHPEILENFRDGYLWDVLKKDDSKLADQISEQSECLIIRGTLDDTDNLNYFRNIIGLIEWLYDNGIVAVFDPHAFKWWNADNWHEMAFKPANASPTHHVTILYSNEDGKEWLHTRGMIKFGRPDLSFRNVPFESRADAARMINKFITIQAYGEVVKEGQSVEMDGIPSGISCSHQGHLDDPDFNNVHIEMVWPE